MPRSEFGRHPLDPSELEYGWGSAYSTKDNSARRKSSVYCFPQGETLESPVTVSISVLKDTIL